jgi:seryl-tRNA synthetase
MTRTSNNKFAALAGGLLSLAAAGVGIAQEAGGDRYARALAEAAITARYNTQIEQQLQSQQDEIASLEQQLAGLDSTAVDVQSMLQRMYDELVQFVQNDVPFFKEERDQRIQRLTELMQSVETSPSEKFRRLVEAYQIEMEYGRTMSAYRQTLTDGREAEMVRLGRVALLYRVMEGGETGYWDRDAKQFVADPDSASQIEEALSIAKEEKAPDLIIVPLPAPQGGRS